MKILLLLVIITAVAGFFLTNSCSEKSRASISALQTQSEDQLASFAGEGDVALELMKNQYTALKERLVKIKTLKRTMSRRASECESTAKRLEAEGKAEMAERQNQLAKRYLANVEKLSTNDIAAEESLKSFAAEYVLFRDEIQVLKEEIEATKAMGGLSDDLGVENPFNKRMETVKDLKRKLQTKLDRAEALVDVHEIESDL
jgi:hypothetical protein